MAVMSPIRSAPAMRAATVGERFSRSRYSSCALPRRPLNTSALPTKPTLITPSGSGIIQNQPSAARWTVMKPGCSFSCIRTPRQCAYTAAVELCLLDRFRPSLPAISVSRPVASRMKRGAYTAVRPVPHGDHAAARRAGQCHVRHPGALGGARAALGGAAEQDLVERRARHLVGGRWRLVQRQVERERAALAGLVVDELGAGLERADRRHRVGHAQPAQQRHVGRQQRLADVEARMLGLLQQHHVAATLGQQRRRRAAGRAAADHQDVALGRHAHTIPPLMEIACPVM